VARENSTARASDQHVSPKKVVGAAVASPPGPDTAANAHSPQRSRARRTGNGYPKGAATRERLISAVQDAIHEVGFSRASSREVARRSGLTFGVIQHHFGSYEGVLLATVRREGERLRELLASAEITGVTTQEKLSGLVELIWSFVSRPENIVYMEIYNNLMRDPATSGEALETLRTGTQSVDALWDNLMRETFDQREPDPALRRLLFATMRGLAINAWMNQGQLSYDRERMILVAGLAPYFEYEIDDTRAG
jgi:AcrR family transcriptional regulator